MSSSFQSAYRIFHSNETTLLKIHNDLILAVDRGEVTSLIRLDLSAAFDTVDHSILLTRLQNWFGLDGFYLFFIYLFISILQQHLQHLQFIKFNYFQSMMLKGAGRSQHLCLSTRS